ncbi:hypothetical protein [Acetobacter cibinongensis]|uniref:hypothetical protein n=1 Tax=Acetobacter cibinongensis TaxID=146475 RepID=UPI000A37C6A4|nr:hypothetical protein [Acetobacter cibinongensis]
MTVLIFVKEADSMALRIQTLVLGTALLLAPGFALAQEQQTPTADSAAAQVGKSPKAALDENGKRIEPSEKLWNNPRTKAEQPGTQPPSNAVPANTTPTSGEALKAPHAYQPGKHKTGHHKKQSVTSPHEGAKTD